jgi:sulfotransferase
MSKQYYFISGLPRSGTTLLSAILNQNPNFYASISGPLARFARAIIMQSSAQGGYRHQCPETKRKKIIAGVFDNYYDSNNSQDNISTQDNIQDNKTPSVFFDTNRGWTLLLPLIKDLYPYTKCIVCVRDLAEILDSFENLIRQNPYTYTNMFSEEENTNVYTRCETLMRPDRTVGFAYNALKQAICSPEKSMLFILEYNNLANDPERMLKALYKFIDQPYYQHDFDDVAVSYEVFDEDVQLPGLHTTRKVVTYIPRALSIPPDIQQRVQGGEVWRA